MTPAPRAEGPLVPLKCVCCGAPMKTQYACEYCGTHYGQMFPSTRPNLFGQPLDEESIKRQKLEDLKTKIIEVRLKVEAAKVARIMDENVARGLHL